MKTIEREIIDINSYLQKIYRIPLLTREEEIELGRRLQDGDVSAREILIKRNLRLVLSIANKYTGRGLSLDELIQYGNIGLIEAIDKYDVTKKTHLSTYATYWIKREIELAIASKTRNIHLPLYLYKKTKKYSEIYSKLQSSLGRKPTDTELALELNLSLKEIKEITEILIDTVSIHDLAHESDKEDALMKLEDKSFDIDTLITQISLKKDINDVLKNSNLSEREKQVILLRNGFIDDRVFSTVEIASLFHLSRESIRLIEKHALTKIRKNKRCQNLIDYTDYPEKALDFIEDVSPKLKNNSLYRIKKKKKLYSIYEYFYEYQEDYINQILSLLNKKDRYLLWLRYGDDLHNPKTDEKWNDFFSTRFYGSVIPKIKKLLKDPNYEKRMKK